MQKLMKFWEEVAKVCNLKPAWHLPNKVEYENSSFALRSFNEGEATPILIIPPNSGHHSSVAEKLIQTCLKAVPEAPVYCIDWLPADAGKDNKEDSICSLIGYVDQSIKTIGQSVHLVGMCQGGWLGVIYAALHNDNVKSLTIGSAPIDCHAAGDESQLHYWVSRTPQTWFDWVVNLSGGIQPGEMLTSGFSSMRPNDSSIGDYGALWQAIENNDEKAVEEWERNRIWFNNPQNVSGKWFLEAVDLLFKQNLLVKKQLEIGGQVVDLANITCPVYMLAGAEDDVIHQKELFSLEKYISSAKIVKGITQGCGHFDMFLQDKAMKNWRKFILAASSDAAEIQDTIYSLIYGRAAFGGKTT